ncbi:MAG: peptidylprolyl isomerase [Myxococcales bacterium]|nr:peptidylprolyl isomerase [Myxococcales bacterium]
MSTSRRWCHRGWLLMSGVSAIVLAQACKKSPPSPQATDAAPNPIASVVPPTNRDTELARIYAAEYRRSSGEITEGDLANRDVVIRRRAARALARIADDPAVELLKKALADEDPEVAAWAAYGLGFACKGRESKTVRALVSRAASASTGDAQAAGSLDLTRTLADALGRCGDPEGEATLRAWLDIGDRREGAALALGRMASRRKRLDDASVVALLDAASRPDKPVESALFAFTRISVAGDAIQARLLDVATDALGGPASARRSFAVRALGRAGPKAVEPLAKVLGNPSFTVAERSDAARELARIGEPGQAALRKSLATLEPKPDALTRLAGAELAPLQSLLDALEQPARDAKPSLERLASLEVPKDPEGLARRIVRLRCRAAVLLAGDQTGHPKLVACDPKPDGVLGTLALLKVLDRGKLVGARGKRWRPLTESKLPTVRQAAIELMASHAEVETPAPLLAKALRAPDAGTVAAAAQIISAYPDRAAEKPAKRPNVEETADDPATPATTDKPPEPVKPHPLVVDALTTAFTLQRPADSIEVWTALADAAGALQVLSFKPRLDAFCKGNSPVLREHAEKALRVMGEKRRVCKAEANGKVPAELSGAVSSPVKLVFETDAGEVTLELDPALAPVAVTRFVELARAGFFVNVPIHRVVPGFVVQLGDPGGDGYGGAGKEPLPCETSPAPFDALSVGVALAGRDTGSSQLFVTLAAFPHLDGDYALIGRAEPGWEKIAQGDVVHKVRVTP